MKNNNRIYDKRLTLADIYILKDGRRIKREAIIKKDKRFKKLYIDTAKHEQDIRRWIKDGIRKKGDIRRSLEGLESKYQELRTINDELTEITYFNNFRKTEQKNMIQLNKNIEELFAREQIERKNAPNKEKEQKNNENKNVELISDIKAGHANKKEKKKFFDLKKIGKRVATFAIAVLMTAFSGVRAGEKNNEKRIDTNEKNSYTDVNKEIEKESFRRNLYVDAEEVFSNKKDFQKADTQTEKSKASNIENKNTNINKNEENIIKFNDSNYYIAKANTMYTEVSDGSGKTGYFSEDTEVRVYNRALVKTDKNGNKRILKSTKVGQTWKQYAEENDLDYNEFIQYINNNNIQKYVSLDSADGENEYGWVLENSLQEIEKTGEIER